MDRTVGHQQQPHHPVRPRWVWGGLVVALGGTTVAGIGVAREIWWVSAVGAVALVVGALGSLHGGAMYDTRSQLRVGEELEEVVRGDVHEGIGPDERLHDAAVESVARDNDAERRRIERASVQHVRPGLSSIGVHLVLLVSVWLLISQQLYPHTVTGKENALRALGLGVLAALGALWLRQVGASRLALGLCVVAGIGLLVNAVWATHGSEGARASELIAGPVVITGALMSLDRRHGGDMTSVRGSS